MGRVAELHLELESFDREERKWALKESMIKVISKLEPDTNIAELYGLSMSTLSGKYGNVVKKYQLHKLKRKAKMLELDTNNIEFEGPTR